MIHLKLSQAGEFINYTRVERRHALEKSEGRLRSAHHYVQTVTVMEPEAGLA